jgi:Co/Zn/Cd efflux system component
MSASCCGHSAHFEGLSADYRRRLWLVIAINAAMFGVEMGAGALAGSQALQADALDFFADAATYGISLAVIGASLRTRAVAALAKGVSLTLMGLWVFGATAYHVLVLGVPRAEVMGVVGLLALAANLASVLLLVRYKDGDANVRSVWLCSRNDAIGKCGGDGRGARRVGHGDQVAGSGRRGDHGGTVPHLVGADPAPGGARAARRSGRAGACAVGIPGAPPAR